jgi:hypothetical protein
VVAKVDRHEHQVIVLGDNSESAELSPRLCVVFDRLTKLRAEHFNIKPGDDLLCASIARLARLGRRRAALPATREQKT